MSSNFLTCHLVVHSLAQTSLVFFLAVLFLSTLSVKELSERVPSRARSDDADSASDEEDEPATPRKALFDPSDSEDEGDNAKQTPKRKKKEELGSELTPHGRRSRRIQQTAEKKKAL